MVVERLKEVFEFATSESPYRTANKGWIANDVYLQLGSSSSSDSRKNELAEISLLWQPIQKLLSNIFLVLFLSSIFVFCSISFAKGLFVIPRPSFNLSAQPLKNPLVTPTAIDQVDGIEGIDLDDSLLEQESTQSIDLDKDIVEEPLEARENSPMASADKSETISSPPLKTELSTKQKSNFF